MVLSTLTFVLAVFLLAGFTKGIIGLGLPTISMGLLAVVLSPVEAAALLILPSLVTNVWQMVDGPHLKSLLRRLWPLNLGVCLGTWLGAVFLSGLGGPYGALALGVALVIYAVTGLAALKFTVPQRSEGWLGPVDRRGDRGHHGCHRRLRHPRRALPAGDRSRQGRARARRWACPSPSRPWRWP